MSTDTAIEDCIDSAAKAVGSVWPLHSFVTANPLAGFEDQPFHEAVGEAEALLGADGYPDSAVFRRAYEDGRIDTEILEATLAAHDYETDPEASLDAMDGPTTESTLPETEGVDTVLSKWLAAFLDEGQAAWPMPNREDGFYEAFRSVATHDGTIPDSDAITDLPDDPADAIRDALAAHSVDEWEAIMECQLAALPGWTGLLKQRAVDEGAWQSAYPITLTGYLAVRLTLVEAFDAVFVPDTKVEPDTSVPRAECWLGAWEDSYRDELVDPITDASESLSEADEKRPDAQLVFCIDTRSEIIRRRVEATGDYETHGYAGFFGVPMQYSGYDSSVSVDACPPIVDAKHYVTEEPTNGENEERYDRWAGLLDAGKTAIKDLRSNAATAFSFVESTGVGYGGALAARTLVPGRVRGLLGAAADRTPADHTHCAPTLDHDSDAGHDLPQGLTLDDRVEYAATAFELMGIEEFGRLFVFTGHGSETANNPFDSSLDCGACAGNPGGPSARVLATICNDEAVRERLTERGVDVPDDTVFLAGQHNTTTDEIDLYASEVPESHADDFAQLRDDLDTARTQAAAERAGDMGADTANGVAETERRAADWAETRPEWGLAGNAGFVVGPRELTDGLDLDGRAFLHSYDWRTDTDGDALEAIIGGPMVVTQWINTQYYFATVDNATFGSGSKITHNPVGNVGVYQGNGGDIMTGLPLQSLTATDDDLYHQPLRLSTVIHAPVERVTEILRDNEAVAELLDNDWLSLTVVDPTQDHAAFEYESDIEWTLLSEDAPTPEQTPPPAAADD
ncbi:DUF2309 domain-containing protein [Halovenus halobia]|uniref:DUF2309 domain-containing protein n=1 Tax=Halovenus halobia TaxID=3396622 RepID=UPI003F57DD56